MSDAAIPLKSAGRGDRGAEGGEAGIVHVRAPFPPAGAIPWVPRRVRGEMTPASPDGPYEIMFLQSVLAAMREHVSGEPRAPRFGFLLGRLHRCPDTGIHYTVVDRALPVSEEFSEDAPGAFLLRGWAEAQRHYRRHPGLLLGWYHSHDLLGLLLSEGDLDVNRRYFVQPWQCSVLLVPDEARPLGAVFRPGDGSTDAGTGRDPTRFWELPGDSGDESRSFVDWTNYEPDLARERTTAHPPDREPDPDRDRLRDREPDPEEDAFGLEQADAVTPASPARPAPRPTPGSVTESGLVLANDTDERRFPRFRRSRWLLPTIVAVVSLGLVALVVLKGFPGSRGTVPIVAPERVLTPAERSVRALELAIRGYADRRVDFDSGRIGCDLLAAGYARVDDAFLQLAAELGRTTDPEASLRATFEELSASVDDVNRHFDASGCQRPR